MLPDIRSGNAVVRGLSERNAINAPIQGGAADIMKLAMIAVHGELRRKGLQSKIILQVHDELVLDVLLSEQEQVREIVIRCMEGAAELKVKRWSPSAVWAATGSKRINGRGRFRKTACPEPGCGEFFGRMEPGAGCRRRGEQDRRPDYRAGFRS